MSLDAKYVRTNGEISEGRFEWIHRPRRVMKTQVGPLGVLGGAGFAVIGGAMADGDGMGAFAVALCAIAGGALGVLLVGSLAYYMSAARMELRRGKLDVSAGQKKAGIPAGAVAYFGKAEFTRANKWRLSRLNFVVESGPGIEIVSRDRKYITINSEHADAVANALLSQGMSPDALRAPFPDQMVNVPRPPSWREPRP